MTLRLLIPTLGLAALVAAGCGSSEDAAAAGSASASDASSPLPKTPNATAADNAARLKNANMPEDAKRIMGAGKPGGN